MSPTPVRPKPAEFHVFDTTLRDGSQQEGLNLSVDDKLAIAALLDELGVDFIEGGWPGANPSDTAFFAAMAAGALAAAERHPGRVRLHPAGRDAGRRRPADRRAARLRAPRGLHRGQEPRPARRAGAAHHAAGEPRHDHRHRLATCAPRASGSSSTASTSSTATGRTRRTRWRSSAPPPRPAPRSSCCATPTAACCRRGSARSSVRPPPTGAQLGIHCPQRHRLRGRQHPGRGRRRCHARAGHRQRLRRADRQRRPGLGRRQPGAQVRLAVCFRPARCTRRPGSRTRSPR